MKQTEPTCGCWRCLTEAGAWQVQPIGGIMILCGLCGNKRCPHAEDHRYVCTRSNEPNQTPIVGPSGPPAATPIPMRLPCPKCGELHIDEGEFATKVHHTHSCQCCGHTWRPAVVATVGVRFLPGFMNEEIDAVRARCVECGSDTNAPAVSGYTFVGGQWRCEKHSAED